MRLSNKKCLHLNVQNSLSRSGYSLGSSVRTSQESNDSCELQQNILTPQKMTNVIEGIYLGSYISTMDKESIKKHNITHIINCSPSDCPNLFEKDFIYLNINIEDNWRTNLFLVIYVILDFLRDSLLQGGKVLIHCNQGISRSPSIVIAYLIYTQKITADSALEKVKKVYPFAEPNLDFQIQLNEMYQEVTIEDKELQSLNSLSRRSSPFSDSLTTESGAEADLALKGSQDISMPLYLKSNSLNSQITISTPDLPSQKLNYGYYKLNQQRHISRTYNPLIDGAYFHQKGHFSKSKSGIITATTFSSFKNNIIDELEVTESFQQIPSFQQDSQQTQSQSQKACKTNVQTSQHFKRSYSPEGEYPTDKDGNFCLTSSPNSEENLNKYNS